jgi:DNA-binding Lrp family transcriptional regulator
LAIAMSEVQMSNYDEHLIKKYIEESTTIADVLRKLNLDPRGRNYKIVNDVVKKFSLNVTHFKGKSHSKNTKQKTIPWNEILIENSNVILDTKRKLRLIKEGYLQYICYNENCGINSWHDKKLSLQLDHINGNCLDHRIENLRLLCPNCHSQTTTFAGRNIKKVKKDIKNICQCGLNKNIQSKMCLKCFNKSKMDKLTKINWPNNDELINMIKQSNIHQISKKLGVSDAAVKKRLKARGLLDQLN